MRPPARGLTVLKGVRVGREAQGGGAVLALEAAPVEELALGAQPLHHVDPLPAEVTSVAASQVLWELLLHGALGVGGGGTRIRRGLPAPPQGAQPSLRGSAWGREPHTTAGRCLRCPRSTWHCVCSTRFHNKQTKSS